MPSQTLKSAFLRHKLLVVGLSVAAAGVLAAAVAGPEGGIFGSRRLKATLPAGTTLVGSMQSRLTTEGLDPGRSVTLTTTAPVTLSKNLVFPAGATIHGEVTHAKGGGRIEGAPELTIRFRRLEVDGEGHDINADPFRVRGKSDLKESVAEIGGGAVVGGIVGAIAGSTVKGAVVGAVLGTGVAVATKGDQIVLPAGTRLKVRLVEPVAVSWSPPAKS